MSLNETATFSFYCADKAEALQQIHEKLMQRTFTSGDRETVRHFEYFRLREPDRLMGEVRGRYETSVGDTAKPSELESAVDPLECWFISASHEQPELQARVASGSWNPNPSLPEGFRVIMPSGEPVVCTNSYIVSVKTTVANARYLAFALSESGVLEALGPTYVTFA